MKGKQFRTNLIIIIANLFGFAIGYFLYINVYVHNKEERIIETKSRILEQFSNNLQEQVQSMAKNSEEYVSHLLDLDKTGGNKVSISELLPENKDIAYYNPHLKYLRKNDEKVKRIIRKESLIKATIEAKPDTLIFKIPLGNDSRGKMKTVEFMVKYDILTEQLARGDIFNHFMLVNNDKVVYSSLTAKPVLKAISFESYLASIKNDENGEPVTENMIKIHTDSSLQIATISGVSSYDIKISNKPFKLFIKPVEIDHSTWQVCGLVDAGQFNQARKSVAPWVIILIIMIVSVIILGIPFIKLRVLSPTEQLSSGTVINSAVSVFLGACLIFLFLFFIAVTQWNIEQNKNSLINLAGEINSSFSNEITLATQQMTFYDSLYNLNNPSNPKISDTAELLDNPTLNPKLYPFFDYVFWLDSAGMQETNLTTFSRKDRNTDLSTRDYFKYPDEWILPGQSGKRFRMESIVSVTSGVVKAAISYKSVSDKKVIAMTGKFYSVIEPVIPANFKFCIMDAEGKVWFHSDKSKNLKENFITECSHDKNIKAAIFTNVSKILNLNYYDEPYRIYIMPMSPLPLYLVTMYDKQSEHAFQVQTLMLTLINFSFLVIFIAFEALLMFFSKVASKNFRKKTLIMDILRPRQPHLKLYIVVSLVMVITSMLYFLLSNPLNILNPILFAVSMGMIILPFLYLSTSSFSMRSLGSILFIVSNFLMLILTNIVSRNYLSNQDYYLLLTFQGMIIALLILAYFIVKMKFKYKLKYQINISICYSGLIMCLLILFGITPVLKFYESSVKNETITSVKHDDLELSRANESRKIMLKNYYKLMGHNSDIPVAAGNIFMKRIHLGIYSEFDNTHLINNFNPGAADSNSNCTDYINSNKVPSPEVNAYILNSMRPLYNRTFIETKYLGNPGNISSDQSWMICNNVVIFDYFSSNGLRYSDPPVKCRIVSDLRFPQLLSTFHGSFLLPLFFYILIAFVVFGVFFLVNFLVRNMFGLAVLEKYSQYNFTDFTRNLLKSGQSVIVIGTPSVDPYEHLINSLKDNFKITVFDLANPPFNISKYTPDNQEELLIIKNLAFEYYSTEKLEKQFQTIIDLIGRKIRFLIISTSSPYQIREYLKNSGSNEFNEKQTAKLQPDTTVGNREIHLSAFNTIMANVVLLYTPENIEQKTTIVHCNSKSVQGDSHWEFRGNKNKYIRYIISREVSASSYLKKFEIDLLEFYSTMSDKNLDVYIIEHRIIERIMEIGRLYYDNILNSCTPLERFILSDMAEDMILNNKNQRTIIMLLIRGLLVSDGCSIRFMNESFRRHILLFINEAEKKKLQEKIGGPGKTWQGYKLFLALIMTGLILFIFMANKSLFDNLNKLFIVVGGGIVLITNLSGFIAKKETDLSK